MMHSCSICDDATEEAEFCRPCAGLLRWIRDYFRDAAYPIDLVAPTAGLFDELDLHSLDYMDWLLEAEDKLDIDIGDHQAARIETVGQFVRMLKEAGARWPDHREVREVTTGRWGPFRITGWEAVDRPRPPDGERT